MASRLELIIEAERRGILPPDKQPLLDEARRRGLVGATQTPPPIPEPEPAPEPSFLEQAGRSLARGTQAVGRGLADVAGLPVDLATLALNAPSIAGNVAQNVTAPLFGFEPVELPTIKSPVGGSEQIAEGVGNIASRAGFPLVNPEELPFGERALFEAQRFATGALGTGGAAKQVARGGSRLAQRLVPETLGQQAVDTAAGLGAGASTAAAQEVAPDSPVATLGAVLAGGATGAGVAKGTERLANLIARSLPDPAVSAAAGRPISRRRADKAAGVIQSPEFTTDPQQAAAQLRAVSREAALEGEPTPPVDIATDDIGLGVAGRGARIKDPKAFQEADQRLRNAAQERVSDLRNPEADIDIPRQRIEAEAAQRRAAAEAPARQARTELEDLRAENTRLVKELEDERAGKLTERDQDIAATKIAREEAAQAEEDLGGTVAGKRSQDVSASEEISAQFQARKAAAEERKTKAFEEAEEAGRSTPVEGERLADAARAVRDDISDLADTDPQVRNIMRDLDRLAPTEGEEVPEVTVRDLIAMQPRISAARKAAKKAFRGDAQKQLKAIEDESKTILNELADQGDEGAIKFLEANEDFRTTFAPRFRTGTAKDIDVAERAGSPVPPSKVGQRFFAGKEALEQFRLIAGAEGDEAARRFFEARLASVVSGDKINPSRLRSFIEANEGIFQAAPELRAEAQKLLTDVVNKRGQTTELGKALQKKIADRRAADTELRQKIAKTKADTKLSEQQKQTQVRELEVEQAQVEKDLRQGATGTILGKDPAVAVREVFSSKDPRNAMRQVTQRFKNDPEALAGWKEAVVDHVFKKVQGTGKALIGRAEDGEIVLNKLKTFFADNRRTLAQVFDAKEMNDLQRAHKILEPLGKRGRAATVGSPTRENKGIERTIEAGLFATGHNAITVGMIMKRLKVVAGFIPKNTKTETLVKQIWFNPELATLLLERNIAKIRAPKWSAKLTQILGAAAAGRESSDE